MATTVNDCTIGPVTSETGKKPAPGESSLPTERAAILGIFGKNTFWLWLDLGALRIGRLLSGFFLIRYLGPHGFGLHRIASAGGFLGNALIDLALTLFTPLALVP